MLTRRTVRGGGVWWLPYSCSFHFTGSVGGTPVAASSLHPLGEREQTLLHSYAVAGTVRSVFYQVTLPVRAHSHFTHEGFGGVRRGKKHLRQKLDGHRTPEPALFLPLPSLCLLSRWPCSQSCPWSPPEGREKCFPDFGGGGDEQPCSPHDTPVLQSWLWVSLSTALRQSAYLTDLLLPAETAALLQPAGHG